MKNQLSKFLHIMVFTLSLQLSLLLLFSSCVLFSCSKSKNSTVFTFGKVSNAPNNISLISPSGTPDLETAPTIRVGGITSGDTVKLFTDNTCTTQVGSGVATATIIDIITSSLGEAVHTLYANTNSGGDDSDCSTINLSYEVVICPTGYVPVPANETLETDNFCAMKYEAKAWNDANSNDIIDDGEVDPTGCGDGGTCSTANWGIATHEPISITTEQPWRKIDQIKAKAECKSLGANYDLISNPEWMTIARNAENVGSNWTNSTVGDGCMFRGNNGETDCGYNSVTNPDSGSSRDIRAKFTLSNNEEIFDIASNLWEWTDWTTGGTLDPPPTDCAGGWRKLTSVYLLECSLSNTDYNTANGFYNDLDGVGHFIGGAGGAALRGGSWFDDTNSGAFTLGLDFAPSDTDYVVGFRCAWHPRQP